MAEHGAHDAEKGMLLKLPLGQIVEFIKLVGQEEPGGQKAAQAGILSFHDAAIMHSTRLRFTTLVVEKKIAASHKVPLTSCPLSSEPPIHKVHAVVDGAALNGE